MTSNQRHTHTPAKESCKTSLTLFSDIRFISMDRDFDKCFLSLCELMGTVGVQIKMWVDFPRNGLCEKRKRTFEFFLDFIGDCYRGVKTLRESKPDGVIFINSEE